MKGSRAAQNGGDPSAQIGRQLILEPWVAPLPNCTAPRGVRERDHCGPIGAPCRDGLGHRTPRCVRQRPPLSISADPAASVPPSAGMPGATVARARRTGAVADNRRLWDWSPESRMPWGPHQYVCPHRRRADPVQATRAGGRRTGRRTAVRFHARVAPAPGRRSTAGYRRLLAPPGAVHGRTPRRTRGMRECSKATRQVATVPTGRTFRGPANLPRSYDLQKRPPTRSDPIVASPCRQFNDRPERT